MFPKKLLSREEIIPVLEDVHGDSVSQMEILGWWLVFLSYVVLLLLGAV